MTYLPEASYIKGAPLALVAVAAHGLIVGVLVALLVAVLVGVVLWVLPPTRPYAGLAAVAAFVVLLLLLLL